MQEIYRLCVPGYLIENGWLMLLAGSEKICMHKGLQFFKPVWDHRRSYVSAASCIQVKHIRVLDKNNFYVCLTNGAVDAVVEKNRFVDFIRDYSVVRCTCARVRDVKKY